MKIRTTVFAATIIALLNCSAVTAQVLGGGVGGALDGTLSGRMNDVGAMTRGSASGALGAELDTGTLRSTTRDVTNRAAERARHTTGAARDRAASTVNTVQRSSANAAASAAASANSAAAGAKQTATSAQPSVDKTAPPVNVSASAEGNAATSVQTDW